MRDVANWIWQVFSWNFQDSGFNLHSLAFSETWFRLINYSDALNLVEISFFFSKSLNVLISLAAVAYLTNFLTLSYSSVRFHYPLASFKYPCSWIYRWKSVWIAAILVIKTWHFNLEVPVNVDWGKKLLWSTSDEGFCGICRLHLAG